VSSEAFKRTEQIHSSISVPKDCVVLLFLSVTCLCCSVTYGYFWMENTVYI